MTVTAPDLTPFREHMRGKYLASRFAEAWPAGLYDEISGTQSEPGCTLNTPS